MESVSNNFPQTLKEALKFKNKKLGKLINLLSTKEKKQFARWLESELSPKMNKILSLYNMILADKEIEEIWHHLYPKVKCPDSPFNNSTFRKLESQLIAYIEEFMAISAFRASQYFRDLYLIKELNLRKANDLFDNKIRKIRRRMEKDFKLEREYYQMLYYLEVEQQEHLDKDHTKRKHELAGSLGRSFDVWWLHEKLWLANHDLNFQQIKGEQISTLFLDEVLELIEQDENYQEYPLLLIYQKLYSLLQDRGEPEEVKNLIRKHSDLLGGTELRDTFSLIFNYFARKFNIRGEKANLKVLLSLLEWGIEDRIVFINGYLPWNWYKNLVTVCIRLARLDQAKEYLDKFKKDLAEEDQEEAYRFNLAHCYFAEREFRKVIKILRQRYSNVYYEMHSRLILCKTYYELDEMDDLETKLRSLRVFISRQKAISDMLKKTYINQIKLIEGLVKACRVEDFKKLANNLASIYPLAARQWILEKINENLAKLNADLLPI